MYKCAGFILVAGYLFSFVALPIIVKLFLKITGSRSKQRKQTIKSGTILNPARMQNENNKSNNKPNNKKRRVDIWI